MALQLLVQKGVLSILCMRCSAINDAQSERVKANYQFFYFETFHLEINGCKGLRLNRRTINCLNAESDHCKILLIVKWPAFSLLQ